MRKYSVPARYEFSVPASGEVIIEAKNKREAVKLAKALMKDEVEFCSHIRNNGDCNRFEVDPIAVGEIQYYSVKACGIERIKMDLEDMEEVEHEINA